MNDTFKKSGAGAILGAIAMFGATSLGAADPDVAVLQQKHEITKEYVFSKVRLDEVPELDLSVLTPEEMSAAYKDLAVEKGALENQNLFEGLREKVEQSGIACQPLPN